MTAAVTVNDQVSNGLWSALQEERRAIRVEYQRGRMTEPAKHRSADRLHEICGSLYVAELLIPLVLEQHRRSVEWALQRAIAEVGSLSTLPYVDQQKREALTAKLDDVLHLIDSEQFSEAESALRALEREPDLLRMQGLDCQVERLLAGLDSGPS